MSVPKPHVCTIYSFAAIGKNEVPGDHILDFRCVKAMADVGNDLVESNVLV